MNAADFFSSNGSSPSIGAFSRFLDASFRRSSSQRATSSASLVCGTIACRSESKSDYDVVADDGLVHRGINADAIFSCSHKAHAFSPPLTPSSRFDVAQSIPDIFDALDTGLKHTPGRIHLGMQSQSSKDGNFDHDKTSESPSENKTSAPAISVRFACYSESSAAARVLKQLREYPDDISCVGCFRQMALILW